MTDFGTLQDRILDDLNRTDLTSQASDEIKTAIKYYERRRFWFNEQRATLSTSDGTEFYGLPSDFMDEDSIVITVNNWTYPLIKRTYDTLESWFVKSSTFTGYPTDYAIYDEQIRLYPIPNGAYTMTISYIKRLAELSSTADSNAWTDTAEELIRSRAEAQIAARKLHDFQLAQAYRSLETDAYRVLKGETDQRIMTGKTRRRNM